MPDAFSQSLAPPLAVLPTLRRAVALYWRALAPLSLATAGLALPFAALDLALEGRGLGWLDEAQLRGALQLPVAALSSVLVARLFLVAAAVPDVPPRLGPALRCASRRWPEALPALLVSSLVVSMGLLLLVAPGVVAALHLSLVVPLLASTDLNASQSLRRSRALVRGRRWRLAWTLGCALLVTSGLAAGLELLAGVSARWASDPSLRLLLWWALEWALGLCDAGLIAALCSVLLALDPPPSSS